MLGLVGFCLYVFIKPSIFIRGGGCGRDGIGTVSEDFEELDSGKEELNEV